MDCQQTQREHQAAGSNRKRALLSRLVFLPVEAAFTLAPASCQSLGSQCVI